MSLIAELKQAMYDIPLINKSGRKKVAHFCEHNGIHIKFCRARSIWHTLAPSAIKPWWIILEPARATIKKDSNNMTNNNNKTETEVIDNA